MKNWIYGLTLLPLLASAEAPEARLSVGRQLPRLAGELLTGKIVELPPMTSGRTSLLLLGFTYESRFAVEAWAKRFREQFGTQPGVTLYEIPMIGGLARMGKWFITRGMRNGTPKADYENVITVFGGTDAWKQRVGFGDPKAAYLILLDGQGRVAWLGTGVLGEDAFQSLAAEVTRLSLMK